jgi:hypothetical protein
MGAAGATLFAEQGNKEMNYSNIVRAARLTILAEYYADLSEWMEHRPFVVDAKPIERAANLSFDAWGEEMSELAAAMESTPLIESLKSALEEGEFGDVDEPVFWRMLGRMAQAEGRR